MKRHTIPWADAILCGALFAAVPTIVDLAEGLATWRGLFALVSFFAITLSGAFFLRWFLRIGVDDEGLHDRKNRTFKWQDIRDTRVNLTWGLYRGMTLTGPTSQMFVHYRIARAREFAEFVESKAGEGHPISKALAELRRGASSEPT
jgi:hypothetical protein